MNQVDIITNLILRAPLDDNWAKEAEAFLGYVHYDKQDAIAPLCEADGVTHCGWITLDHKHGRLRYPHHLTGGST